jgi:hypothetical protein
MEWAGFEREHRDRPDQALLAATMLASVSRDHNDDIVAAVWMRRLTGQEGQRDGGIDNCASISGSG